MYLNLVPTFLHCQNLVLWSSLFKLKKWPNYSKIHKSWCRLVSMTLNVLPPLTKYNKKTILKQLCFNRAALKILRPDGPTWGQWSNYIHAQILLCTAMTRGTREKNCTRPASSLHNGLKVYQKSDFVGFQVNQRNIFGGKISLYLYLWLLRL